MRYSRIQSKEDFQHMIKTAGGGSPEVATGIFDTERFLEELPAGVCGKLEYVDPNDVRSAFEELRANIKSEFSDLSGIYNQIPDAIDEVLNTLSEIPQNVLVRLSKRNANNWQGVYRNYYKIISKSTLSEKLTSATQKARNLLSDSDRTRLQEQYNTQDNRHFSLAEWVHMYIVDSGFKSSTVPDVVRAAVEKVVEAIDELTSEHGFGIEGRRNIRFSIPLQALMEGNRVLPDNSEVVSKLSESVRYGLVGELGEIFRAKYRESLNIIPEVWSVVLNGIIDGKMKPSEAVRTVVKSSDLSLSEARRLVENIHYAREKGILDKIEYHRYKVGFLGLKRDIIDTVRNLLFDIELGDEKTILKKLDRFRLELDGVEGLWQKYKNQISKFASKREIASLRSIVDKAIDCAKDPKNHIPELDNLMIEYYYTQLKYPKEQIFADQIKRIELEVNKNLLQIRDIVSQNINFEGYGQIARLDEGTKKKVLKVIDSTYQKVCLVSPDRKVGDLQRQLSQQAIKGNIATGLLEDIVDQSIFNRFSEYREVLLHIKYLVEKGTFSALDIYSGLSRAESISKVLENATQELEMSADVYSRLLTLGAGIVSMETGDSSLFEEVQELSRKAADSISSAEERRHMERIAKAGEFLSKIEEKNISEQMRGVVGGIKGIIDEVREIMPKIKNSRNIARQVIENISSGDTNPVLFLIEYKNQIDGVYQQVNDMYSTAVERFSAEDTKLFSSVLLVLGELHRTIRDEMVSRVNIYAEVLDQSIGSIQGTIDGIKALAEGSVPQAEKEYLIDALADMLSSGGGVSLKGAIESAVKHADNRAKDAKALVPALLLYVLASFYGSSQAEAHPQKGQQDFYHWSKYAGPRLNVLFSQISQNDLQRLGIDIPAEDLRKHLESQLFALAPDSEWEEIKDILEGSLTETPAPHNIFERTYWMLHKGMRYVAYYTNEYLEKYTQGWTEEKKQKFFKELKNDEITSELFAEKDGRIIYKGVKGKKIKVEQYLRIFDRFTGISVDDVRKYAKLKDIPDEDIDKVLSSNSNDAYLKTAQIITWMRGERMDEVLPQVRFSIPEQGIKTFGDLEKKHPNLYKFIRDILLLQNVMRGDYYWDLSGGVSPEARSQRLLFVSEAVDWFKDKITALYKEYYDRYFNIDRDVFERAVRSISEFDVWREFEKELQKREGESRVNPYRVSAEIFVRYLVGILINTTPAFPVPETTTTKLDTLPVPKLKIEGGEGPVFSAGFKTGSGIGPFANPDLRGEEARDILATLKWPDEIRKLKSPFDEIKKIVESLPDSVRRELNKVLDNISSEINQKGAEAANKFLQEINDFEKKFSELLFVLPDDVRSDIYKSIADTRKVIEESIKSGKFDPKEISNVWTDMIGKLEEKIMQAGSEIITEKRKKYSQLVYSYYKWVNKNIYDLSLSLDKYANDISSKWNKYLNILDEKTSIPKEKITEAGEYIPLFIKGYRENAISWLKGFYEKIKTDFERAVDVGGIQMEVLKYPSKFRVRGVDGMFEKYLDAESNDLSLYTFATRYRQAIAEGKKLPPWYEMIQGVLVTYVPKNLKWFGQGYSADVYDVFFDGNKFSISYGGIETYKNVEPHDSNPVKGKIEFTLPKVNNDRFFIESFNLSWFNAGPEGKDTLSVSLKGVDIKGKDKEGFNWNNFTLPRTSDEIFYKGKKVDKNWLEWFIKENFAGVESVNINGIFVQLPSGFTTEFTNIYYNQSDKVFSFDSMGTFLPHAERGGGTEFYFKGVYISREKFSAELANIIADDFETYVKRISGKIAEDRKKLSVEEFRVEIDNWGNIFVSQVESVFGENSIEIALARAKVKDFKDQVFASLEGLTVTYKNGETYIDLEKAMAVTENWEAFLKDFEFEQLRRDYLRLQMSFAFRDLRDYLSSDSAAERFEYYLKNSRESDPEKRYQDAAKRVIGEYFEFTGMVGVEMENDAYTAYLRNVFVKNFKELVYANIGEILLQKGGDISKEDIQYALRVSAEAFFSEGYGKYIYGIIKGLEAGLGDMKFVLGVEQIYAKEFANLDLNAPKMTPEEVADRVRKINKGIEADLQGLKLEYGRTGDFTAYLAFMRLERYKEIADAWLKEFEAKKKGSEIEVAAGEGHLDYSGDVKKLVASISKFRFSADLSSEKFELGIDMFTLVEAMRDAKDLYAEALLNGIIEFDSKDLRYIDDGMLSDIDRNARAVALQGLQAKYGDNEFIFQLAEWNMINWGNVFIGKTKGISARLNTKEGQFSLSVEDLEVLMKNEDWFKVQGFDLNVDRKGNIRLAVEGAGVELEKSRFISVLDSLVVEISKERTQISFDKFSAELIDRFLLKLEKMGIKKSESIEEAFLQNAELYAMIQNFLLAVREKGFYMDDEGNINLDELLADLGRSKDGKYKGKISEWLSSPDVEELLSIFVEGYNKKIGEDGSREEVFDRLGFTVGEIIRIAISGYVDIDSPEGRENIYRKIEADLNSLLNFSLKEYFFSKTGEKMVQGFEELKILAFKGFIEAVVEGVKEEIGAEGNIDRNIDSLYARIGRIVNTKLQGFKQKIDKINDVKEYAFESFVLNAGSFELGIKEFISKLEKNGMDLSASEIYAYLADILEIKFNEVEYLKDKERTFASLKSGYIDFLKGKLRFAVEAVMAEKRGDKAKISADLVQAIFGRWKAEVTKSWAEFENNVLSRAALNVLVENGDISWETVAEFDRLLGRFDVASKIEWSWAALMANAGYYIGEKEAKIYISEYDPNLGKYKKDIISFEIPDGTPFDLDVFKKIALGAKNMQDFAEKIKEYFGDRDVKLKIGLPYLAGIMDVDMESNKVPYNVKVLAGILNSLKIMFERNEIEEYLELNPKQIKELADIVSGLGKDTKPYQLVDFMLKNVANTSVQEIAQEQIDLLTYIILKATDLYEDPQYGESGLRGELTYRDLEFSSRGGMEERRGFKMKVFSSSEYMEKSLKISYTTGDIMAALSPSGSDVLNSQNSPLNIRLPIEHLLQLSGSLSVKAEFTDGIKGEIRFLGGLNWIDVGSAFIQAALANNEGERVSVVQIPVMVRTDRDTFFFPSAAISLKTKISSGKVYIEPQLILNTGGKVEINKDGLQINKKPALQYIIEAGVGPFDVRGANLPHKQVIEAGLNVGGSTRLYFNREYYEGSQATGIGLQWEGKRGQFGLSVLNRESVDRLIRMSLLLNLNGNQNKN